MRPGAVEGGGEYHTAGPLFNTVLLHQRHRLSINLIVNMIH